ncbi:MAG TPA: universal stress protein [Dehalococcoidia bacterium]|jgi:nucleotide-binding universal stress UspA family protein|nr:universal stress protein [Dehalococcoidia bacterium]
MGLRVLWAIDGSEKSLAGSGVIRQQLRGACDHLIILCVAPGPVFSGARPDPIYLKTATRAGREHALEAAMAHAQESASAVGDIGATVETASRWGHPIPSILDAAKETEADLIVVSAKGHSNLALLALGSVAEGVVNHATIPVLLARPDEPVDRSILLGYDATEPARRALEFVPRIRPDGGDGIHVATIIEPFPTPAVSPPYRAMARKEAHEINEQRKQAAATAIEEAVQLLARHGLKATGSTHSGEPANEIIALAEAQHAGLIVVGSQKPSRVRRYLLGSVAAKLVRFAPISVLVVR